MSSTLDEIALQNPMRWPHSREMQVPYRVFTDPEIFAAEQGRIFRGPHWSFAALETEVLEPNAFKTTYIGDTPIVITRDKHRALHAWVNRCAHRGALVCRDRCGKAEQFTCAYHQWAYDATGALTSVPFRRGVSGQGGMPTDFDMAAHGLRALRVAVYRGLVFVSFAAEDQLEPLPAYLGPDACQMLDRLFRRPLRLLGDERQVIHGNWKLYAENTRDPYHGSLLHLFHATFGTYRATQKGSCVTDETGRHSMITATREESQDKKAIAGLRTYQAGQFTLEDPSLLAGRPDFDDGVSLVILSVFPNLVVQQIANSLAVRQIQARSVDETELVWTYFGYADDSEEVREYRLRQMNLVGPGGLISMEDGEAVEIVQQAVLCDGDVSSYIAMGGGKPGTSQASLISEKPIVSLWEYYRRIMGFTA